MMIQRNLGNGAQDGTGFSWLFSQGPVIGRQEPVVSKEDRVVLRTLGQKVKGLSELPVQRRRRERWAAHHALKPTKPLLFIDPELAWYEILPAHTLRCTGNLARIWEYRLRKEIFWQEEIQDDRVCRPVLPVQHVYQETGFGLEKDLVGGGDTGAYSINSVLKDYDDLPKLSFRSMEIDQAKTDRLLAVAHDVFDGVLEARIENAWWFSFGLTMDAIFLRGFENFLLDMYDHPEGLHALMGFLRDEAMNRLDFLEKNRLLSLNNNGEFMGTGGYGWCDELPGEPFDPSRVTPRNMWGYAESQETVSASPDAFGEFVLPYQLPLLSRFGLNAYGCCEPLDTRLDLLKQNIPRLRKITVSPWSDARMMAREIGGNYVYCWKMNPTCIAADRIDEDGIRAQAREVFTIVREYGCPTEALMRDVRTLAGKKENAVRWVAVLREEADRIFGPD
jgi:hypothetical protein